MNLHITVKPDDYFIPGRSDIKKSAGFRTADFYY